MSQNPQNETNAKVGTQSTTSRKKYKIRLYWILGVFFVVFIGAMSFQFFGTFPSRMKEIDQNHFLEILGKGDINKFVVFNKDHEVRITLKGSSLPAYSRELGTITNKTGPHMYFKVVSGDFFVSDMRRYYSNHPEIEDVGFIEKDQ